jgi:hypothetical protein
MFPVLRVELDGVSAGTSNVFVGDSQSRGIAGVDVSLVLVSETASAQAVAGMPLLWLIRWLIFTCFPLARSLIGRCFSTASPTLSSPLS